MKKHIKVIVTLLVALSFAAVVSAEDDMKYEGTISNINTIANTFDLKTGSGNISLYVAVMSKMRINGENKPLSAIPSGSDAKCTAFTKRDRLSVRECIVTPKQ